LRAGISELDQLAVVLVRPRNPLNIGAVARAMSNFGPRDLRLVNPYGVAFREARSAVGASAVLENAREFDSVADAVADCSLVAGTTAVRNRVLQNPLRTLNDESASAIRAAMESGRVALLFGSERIGLTNKDFTHCHWLLNIPTHEQNISMNLGQAVAVCLFGLSRNVVDEAIPEQTEPAASGEIEKITQGLYEALKVSGYVKPGNDAVSEKKVRRLMLRFNLQAIDAKVLLGMVRQIVWKLRQEGKD
jgi:TrmH family RNA methyltransferase